jgi:ATP-dependent helicase/nuclease subunit A
MGEEIEEALDVLLAQALAYEATEVPSLTGFLTWHEAGAVTVKRQTEGSGDKVRVMTVHGAKGLESRVVILPDTADYAPPLRQRLLRLANGQPVFRGGDSARAAEVAAALAAERQAAEEESNRLLYVALTRAQSWLIVCGAGKDAAQEDPASCWHRKVALAMQGMEPRRQGDGWRLQFGDWPAAAAPQASGDNAPQPALPDWALATAPAMAFPPAPLSPSGLGPMAHAGEPAQIDPEDALRRGSQLHLLLEHLPRYPAAAWPEIGAALLRGAEMPADDDEIADRLAEARSVLSNPELQTLFAGDSLAEVDVSAALPELAGRRIHGRIDRLLRRPGGVLAVDFKSNRQVPDTVAGIPDGILMQLGAYRSALRQIFPGERVEVAVLWTRAARLMPVPDDMVIAALRRATTS